MDTNNNEMVSENEANKEVLAVSIPSDSLDLHARENFKQIVKSKEALIKKALAAEELKMLHGKGTISFPWFRTDATPEEAHAYTTLISKLCEMARNQKRVNAKEKEVENEKYAFRCFLLRLGFIGDEYKEDRKALLKNFSGSSAFKNGKES